LKPKLTYATGRNPHEDFSEDEVNSRYPQYTSRSSRLQEDGEARRYSMVSTNPKATRNRSLTTGRHTVGGAPPSKAFSAQAQDGPEEWFSLGLTCTLVVRKRRGLSRWIQRAYQDQIINALVHHSQRAVSLKLKVYANIKLQGATHIIEDSIKRHKGSDDPKPTKATRAASTLQDLICKLKTF
jgi:hypothetical protein